MGTEENLHAGHRKRSLEKFLAHPESFCEHEILEIILFFALPRVDTNPIAHRLIKTFGSLEKVFLAKEKELKTVEGVGDKAAALLMLFGSVGKIIQAKEKEKVNLSTPESVINFVREKIGDKLEESFLLILTDKQRNVITTIEFCDNHRHDVSMKIPEISNALAIHKPEYAIIAHNHPSGDPSPSNDDDLSTKKIHLLCSLNGTSLIDHVIYAGGKYYRYHSDFRLENIKNQIDVNKLLDNIKEKHYNE